MPETLTIELREPTGQQAPAPMPRPVPPSAGYQQPTIPGFPWLKMPVQPPQAGYQQPVSPQAGQPASVSPAAGYATPTAHQPATAAPARSPQPAAPVPAPPPPVFDPVAMAREQLRKERERAQVAAAYQRLNPSPAFDPMGIARERLAQERQAAAVAKAYEELTHTNTATTQYMKATGTGLRDLATASVLATRVFHRLTNQATELSEKLAPYSPALTMARAQAEVRQILGDIRRAGMLGSDLGRFTEAQSRLSQNWQDVKAAFARDYGNPIATGLTNMANGFIEWAKEQAINRDAIKEAMNAVISGQIKLSELGSEVKKNVERMTKLAEERRKEEESKAGKWFSDILNGTFTQQDFLDTGRLDPDPAPRGMPVFRGV